MARRAGGFVIAILATSRGPSVLIAFRQKKMELLKTHPITDALRTRAEFFGDESRLEEFFRKMATPGKKDKGCLYRRVIYVG